MCVIVAKNKGSAIPEKDVLERCWNSNIDGAGFSVTKGNKVLIQKGFMKFDDLYKALGKYSDKDTLVIHFRRATQGDIAAGLTHPFPLVQDDAKIRALSLETDCAISHNGSIPMTSTPACRKKFLNNSDTEIFVRDYATKLFEKPSDLKDSAKLQILAALIGESKLAIHTPEGIKIIGWFDEKDGVYFSNFSNAVYFDHFISIK